MKIFAEQITREKSLVYDLRAEVNGEKRYFIVSVSPAKRAAFLRMVENDAGFRLEDYGDILHRGWNAPEPELKRTLYERFGMYAQEMAKGT